MHAPKGDKTEFLSVLRDQEKENLHKDLIVSKISDHLIDLN